MPIGLAASLPTFAYATQFLFTLEQSTTKMLAAAAVPSVTAVLAQLEDTDRWAAHPGVALRSTDCVQQRVDRQRGRCAQQGCAISPKLPSRLLQ